MMMRTWEELIAVGRELTTRTRALEKTRTEIAWEWGDLAVEIHPSAAVRSGTAFRSSNRTEEVQRLRDFYDAVECPYTWGTLLQYRTTALAWKPEERIPNTPIMAHILLKNAKHLLREGMTVANAADAAKTEKRKQDHDTTTYVASYGISYARLARALKNPDVIKRVVTDYPELVDVLIDALADLVPNLGRRCSEGSCSRKATANLNGKWYCALHVPSRILLTT